MLTLPNPFEAGGRLSLSPTDSTALVSASGTLYYLPHKSPFVTIYNGVKWVRYKLPSTGLTLTLSGYAAGNYDVYIAPSGINGGLQLLLQLWTGNTVRSYTPILQDFVPVNSVGYKYLGTIRLSATGVCNFSTSQKFVWNQYNQIDLTVFITQANTYNNTYAGWRESNNGTGMIRGEFVCGGDILMVPLLGMYGSGNGYLYLSLTLPRHHGLAKLIMGRWLIQYKLRVLQAQDITMSHTANMLQV